MILEQLLIQIIQLLNVVLGAVLPEEITAQQRRILEDVVPVLYAGLKFPARRYALQSTNKLDDATVNEMIELCELINQKYQIPLQ